MVSPFFAVIRKRRVILERSPQFRIGRKYVFETGRHHANDGVAAGRVEVAAGLQCHRAPYDVRVRSKATTPETIAQDQDIRAVKLIVGRLEIATENWNNAKRPKVIRGYALSPEKLRLTNSHHRGSPHLHNRHRIEGVVLRERLERTEARQARAATQPFKDHHDSVGTGIGERLEEDRIDRAEDRSCGANAKAEDHDGGGS